LHRIRGHARPPSFFPFLSQPTAVVTALQLVRTTSSAAAGPHPAR
jgi:hypothetical protein